MAKLTAEAGQDFFSRDISLTDAKFDGSLEFVLEIGGNASNPSYQEASGAPVENISPLGLQVTSFTTIFLNFGQIIGTGVFATPATILRDVGSIGLSLLFWVLGLFVAGSQLAVYMELASYFPNRSGAEVVYLEQAYPRPKYLLPFAFAVQSVLLSFSSSNAIIMAQLLYATGEHTPTPWHLKGLAVGCITFIILLISFSTKYSLRLSNAIGIVKITTLIFISITGFVVLGGHTRVKDPHANFHDSFSDTTSNGYGLANALVKVNFAYTGYTNAFNVVNEVKHPIKTLKRTAPLSLLVVATLYVLCNIAYMAAVPKASLKTSPQLPASLFFSAVFGSKRASRALNFLIALSAFGNIVSVVIGTSRVLRECGRQGVIPFPRFWAETRPFSTPLGPYFIIWAVTVLMILAPPAGDAFNFIVDLQSYPANLFAFATNFGLLLIRRRRVRLGLPRTEFRVWNLVIAFSLAVNVFLLAMPWVPPPGGRFDGDVSFWYATYCVVGIALSIVCVVYYLFWMYIIPHLREYRIRQELRVLHDSNIKVHQLVKVPITEVEAWDREHNALGQKIDSSGRSSDFGDDSQDVRVPAGLSSGEKAV